jgi:hypothetical protein
MATSEISISNDALAKLGEARILSFADDVKAARLTKAMYPIQRDKLLRLHNWNFATKRVQLAKLTETPVWGFSSFFQLPADHIRTWQIDSKRSKWKVEGDRIAADLSALKILYIAKITDPAKFDTLFVELLSSMLAMELAMPISDSKTLFDLMTTQFEKKKPIGFGIDSMEGVPDELEIDTFLNAR